MAKRAKRLRISARRSGAARLHGSTAPPVAWFAVARHRRLGSWCEKGLFSHMRRAWPGRAREARGESRDWGSETPLQCTVIPPKAGPSGPTTLTPVTRLRLGIAAEPEALSCALMEGVCEKATIVALLGNPTARA